MSQKKNLYLVRLVGDFFLFLKLLLPIVSKPINIIRFHFPLSLHILLSINIYDNIKIYLLTINNCMHLWIYFMNSLKHYVFFCSDRQLNIIQYLFIVK